jgi:hypothetical protein
MDSARKIELQSPEDLAYLVENVRRAATARIDEAFPPVDDNTEDELRSRIEELVNEVCFLSFFFGITFPFPFPLPNAIFVLVFICRNAHAPITCITASNPYVLKFAFPVPAYLYAYDTVLAYCYSRVLLSKGRRGAK